MSTYLGRIVDRAVGPPAAAVSPRLAPVFPLGRAVEAEAEPLSAEGVRAREERAAPPATREKTVGEGPGLVVRELREVREEQPTSRSREAVAQAGAPAQPAQSPPTEIRTHERTTLETVRHEVEPARPAKARARAAPRVERRPVPTVPRPRIPVPEPPRIEVRIGRVEVRRPPQPEPVELPASPTAAQPAATGFGKLAAARRYVDRSWS